MKLRSKFIVLALTVSLIPATISGFIVYSSAKTMLVKSLDDRLQGIATVQKERVNAYLDSLSDVLRIISGKTLMKSNLALYNKTGDLRLRDRITGDINEMRSANPDILEISIYDAYGKVIVSTNSYKIGTAADNDNFLARGTKFCGLTDILQENNNAITIHAGCPLTLDGRLIGITDVTKDADKLMSITRDHTGLGRSGETVLAMRDLDGDALFLTPVRSDKEAALTHKESKLDKKIAIIHALAKEEGFLCSATDYRGNEVMAATRYIDKADWGLVVKIDKTEAMSQLNQIRKYTLYEVIALTMAMVVIASVFSRKITGPLLALTKAAKKIGKDDFYKIVEESGDDEVGILVSTFNEMTDKLIKSGCTAAKYLVEIEASNSRLNRLLEASFEGVTITEEHRIIDVNNQCAKMFGYEPGEMPGMSMFDYVVPQYRETFIKNISDGYEKPFEVDCLKKDGTVIRVEICGKKMKYEDRRIIMSALRDITRRKKMEEELRLQSEIIMNMEEGVVLIKACDGKIVYTNPKFNRMFGYEEGELTGKDISRVHAPTDVSSNEVTERIISPAKETGSWQWEVLNIKKDGTRFWCHAIVSTFNHNVYGTVWVSIHHDITKRKKAERLMWEAGERLRAIIDNSTAMISLKDTEGKYMLINSQFEKLFNVKMDDITGKTDYELFDSSLADEIRKNDKEVLIGLKPMQYIENIPKDNVMHVYVSIRFPLFDANARLYGICGIATDITELKRNEEEYKNLSQQFMALLKAIPDNLILLSPDLKIVWANTSAIESVRNRLNVTDLTRQYCYRLFFDRLSACHECQTLKCFESGEVENNQLMDSRGKIWEIRAVPIKDRDGKTINVIELSRDVTEKITMQKNAITARHLASLGEIAAGVAHEINNPINGIITCAQLIADATTSGTKIFEYAVGIMNEAERIANIVKSLLSFSRESKSEKTVTDICKSLIDMLSLAGAQMRKDGIALIVDLPDNLPRISANKQQLQQVFLNIINNSRYALNEKYNGKHKDKIFRITGEELKVAETPYLRLKFLDYGTGIPPRFLEKVKEPFFSTKSAGKGTGLGLSISHGIIADHNGRLDIESLEGHHTCITIELPAARKEEIRN
ncbi:MAG: PAS domain S-box protein [Nitrospirae bacterium]|nr:PAS domain S-box protein [Nitrospirota bacterium]